MPGIVNLLPHRGHFPSPESIFWLLLTGDVPTESQTRSLIHDWASRRQRRNNWLSECQTILKALPQRLGALEKLSIILMSLDSTDKHVKDSLRSKLLSHEQWEVSLYRKINLFFTRKSKSYLKYRKIIFLFSVHFRRWNGLVGSFTKFSWTFKKFW